MIKEELNIGDVYRNDLKDSQIIIISNIKDIISYVIISDTYSKFDLLKENSKEFKKILSLFENGFCYYYYSNNKKIVRELMESYFKLYPNLEHSDLSDDREKSIDHILKQLDFDEDYPEFKEYLNMNN